MTTKNATMGVSTKLKLASLSRARCTKCNSVRTYLNPLAKCFECMKKFCFDDINCLQVNNAMKENDEARHICDECKEKYEYITM